MKRLGTRSRRDKGHQMREIRVEGARRWDFGLACGSLSLVMLVLTGAPHHSQHHKPRSAQAVPAFAELVLLKRQDVSRRSR
jgi:hypothetical protein